MSVSMKSTKKEMYAEIEKLRLEVDRLRNTKPAPVAPRARVPQTLQQFCSIYCATHGVNSVPGDVVREWKRNNA